MTITYLLALAAAGLTLAAFWIDRDELKRSPLTPLTAPFAAVVIKGGISPVLVSKEGALSLGVEKYVVMSEFTQETQMLWLVFGASLIAVFSLKKKKGNRIDLKVNRAKLYRFCLCCGLFSLAWISLGTIVRSNSRSDELYSLWVERFWKPDMLFTAFSRFRDIFFFLLPIALIREVGLARRLLLISPAVCYILAALVAGGRGIVLIPLQLAYAGLFTTGMDKRIVAALGAGLLVIGMAGGIMLDSNLSAENVRKMSLERLSTKIGADLYGCSDAYAFTERNQDQPPAGLARSKRWLFGWVPSVARGGANNSVRDSHIIATELKGKSRKEAEEMVYTSFPCVSFGADLFWRGRWWGVVLGSLIFAWLYCSVSALWYRHASLDAYTSTLILAFPSTFIGMYPAGSVGETIWLWTWDIGKYVLVGLMILFWESKSTSPSNEDV